MSGQRFRFDTIDEKLVLKLDILMITVQLVISIIYIGSWASFFLVRAPRLLWGLMFAKWRLQIFHSGRGLCMMKADWILRLVTLILYVGIAFGFSTWLPEQFCALLEKEDDSFNSCKW
jgi:hypothetical protein